MVSEPEIFSWLRYQAQYFLYLCRPSAEALAKADPKLTNKKSIKLWLKK